MNNSLKSDTRWTEFFCDIFGAQIMFFVGDKKDLLSSAADALARLEHPMAEALQKEFVKKLKLGYASQLSGIDGECSSLTASSGEKLWIVWIADFNGSVDRITTLSHECLHAALSVLDCCGVSENPPFECLCYLHQAICKKFLAGASAHIGILRKDPPAKQHE